MLQRYLVAPQFTLQASATSVQERPANKVNFMSDCPVSAVHGCRCFDQLALFMFTKITTVSLGIYLFILLWLLPKIKQINIAFFKDMSN